MNKPILIKSEFTFIELLIAVAIIAILVSLLFPVFGRFRESGTPFNASGKDGYWAGVPGLYAFQGSFLSRHLDTANYLFMDGQVKALTVDQLTSKTCGFAGCYSYFTTTAD